MARRAARDLRGNRAGVRLDRIRRLFARPHCDLGFQGHSGGRLRQAPVPAQDRHGRSARCLRSAPGVHFRCREPYLPAAADRRAYRRHPRHSLWRTQHLGRDRGHADDLAPAAAALMSSRMPELLAIMARLRSPGGCPWDRRQTFATIAPYTVEEAYEVADAIERDDLEDLKGELGDLLFQVVFHAQMAKEAGSFDFDDVAGAICDKLQRRHPHVFGDAEPLSIEEQSAAWEDIKAAERGCSYTSALHGVPKGFPALLRAFKLSKRAARVGFDFEHAGQCADKVEEELAEVRAAARNASDGTVPAAEVFEEIGDLLFAAANLARKLDVDAEAALRAANTKFERRFRAMEALGASRGPVVAEVDLA